MTTTLKAVYDENLPPRLVLLLADVYPGPVHVRDVDLRSRADELVWLCHRSLLFGFPPKVIKYDSSD